ncbi:hypothetical protein Patl1_18023 [Pistacia atlantica]|uniref:Uncharacterized protein n=1 Tax=Pistacia atlantica TaxID=434234 RepID=A0ACC1BZE1_9ROSI|nr:hypothetical protein Patl1_18023 [Pistacia atlantica]
MAGKFMDIRTAECIFKRVLDDESVRRNTVIWNVMIRGYISNGYLSLALEFFIEMLNLGIRPDSSTILAVLVLCSESLDLTVGKQIHGLVFSHGLRNDVRTETALMDMYFKCGDPEAGLTMFSQSQNRNLVMWSAVVSNCAQDVLRACSALAFKSRGMEIHGLAVKLALDADTFLGGAIVDMYGKCGDLESAQKVFSGLPSRDLISWNALISGYSQNECAVEAFES